MIHWISWYVHHFMFLFNRILIRPHPAIWRLVHGMAVIYLVALTFLLFQVSSLLLYCFAYWTLNCTLFYFICASKDTFFVSLACFVTPIFYILQIWISLDVHFCFGIWGDSLSMMCLQLLWWCFLLLWIIMSPL